MCVLHLPTLLGNLFYFSFRSTNKCYANKKATKHAVFPSCCNVTKCQAIIQLTMQNKRCRLKITLSASVHHLQLRNVFIFKSQMSWEVLLHIGAGRHSPQNSGKLVLWDVWCLHLDAKLQGSDTDNSQINFAMLHLGLSNSNNAASYRFGVPSKVLIKVSSEHDQSDSYIYNHNIWY